MVETVGGRSLRSPQQTAIDSGFHEDGEVSA